VVVSVSSPSEGFLSGPIPIDSTLLPVILASPADEMAELSQAMKPTCHAAAAWLSKVEGPILAKGKGLSEKVFRGIVYRMEAYREPATKTMAKRPASNKTIGCTNYVYEERRAGNKY
jgi:hypothetical protein